MSFLLQLFVLLAVAHLCGEAARRLRQPAVLGELIGGILIGRTIFGNLAPELFERLFRTGAEVDLARDAVISMGLLFFLFTAGLEIDFEKLRGQGRRVGVVSAAGLLVPFFLGLLAVLAVPSIWRLTPGEEAWPLALLLGTSLTISALPVIARVLMDLRLMHEDVGMIIMASAMVNDILGWVMFAIILSVFSPTGGSRPLLLTLALALGFAGFALTAGRSLSRRLLAWVERLQAERSSALGVAIAGVLLAAILTEWIGLHAILGAFLVGIGLAPGGGRRVQAFDAVKQLSVSFFAPVYFASLGLGVDFAGNFDLTLVLVVLGIASLGKIGGVGTAGRVGGMQWREALAVGSGLNARGALGAILASLALQAGMIDERIYVALVIMAVVTSLMSGPLIQKLVGEARI